MIVFLCSGRPRTSPAPPGRWTAARCRSSSDMRAVMGLLFFPRGGLGAGGALPGPLAAGGRLGRDASPAARSAQPGGRSHAGTFYAGVDVRALDYTASRRGARPARRRPAVPPLLRGPPGRPRPGLRARRRRRLRAPGGRLGAPAGGGGRRRGRRAPPPPPDADQRGRRARLPRRAAHRPPARHRAADAARDRGGPAARAGTTPPSGPSGCGAGRAAASGCWCSRPTRCGACPTCSAWTPSGSSGRPTASTRRVSTAGPHERGAGRALAALAGGGAARLGRVAASRAAWPTPTSSSRRSRTAAPVLLYVGRFTEVKRVPLLIRAHARARERFERPAPLVLLGGFPGEWEGEHPLEAVRETGDPDVFLAGWRGHEDLPDGLNAADLLVLPSVREQFGAVIVEAMACGLPALAVDAYGPAEIVDAGETGWLVPPDDEARWPMRWWRRSTTTHERRRRGRARLRGRPRPLLVAGAGARAGGGLRRGRRRAPAVRGHAYADARLDRDPVPHPALRPGAPRAHPRGRRRGRGGGAAALPAARGRAVRGGEARLDRAHAAAHARDRGRAAAGAAGATGARCPTWASASSLARARASAGRRARARGPPRRRAARGAAAAARRCATRSSAGTGAARATRWRPRLDAACARWGSSYTKLQIRGQRTRWASCSSSGRDELQLAAAAGARRRCSTTWSSTRSSTSRCSTTRSASGSCWRARVPGLARARALAAHGTGTRCGCERRQAATPSGRSAPPAPARRPSSAPPRAPRSRRRPPPPTIASDRPSIRCLSGSASAIALSTSGQVVGGVEDAGDEDHRQEDRVGVGGRRVLVGDRVREGDAQRGEADHPERREQHAAAAGPAASPPRRRGCRSPPRSAPARRRSARPSRAARQVRRRPASACRASA